MTTKQLTTAIGNVGGSRGLGGSKEGSLEENQPCNQGLSGILNCMVMYSRVLSESLR